MGKEQLELLSTPPQTLEFLREVINDPRNPVYEVASKHSTEMHSYSNKAKTLKLNIMGAYLLTPATLQEVGDLYGITRQGIWWSVAQAMGDLWNASSPETKAKFPEGVPFGKEKNKISHKHFRIVRDLLDGKTLGEQGFDIHEISSLRGQLKKYGIEVPRKTDNLKKLAKDLKEATEDLEIKRYLEKVDKSFYQNIVFRRGQKVTVPLKEVAQDFVFYLRNAKFFVDSLKRAGLPIASFPGGAGHYHVIAAQHLGRARTILENDPNLKEFTVPRVKQISGPEAAEMPTTYQLVKTKGFERVSTLLKELGAKIGGRTGTIISDFLEDDCPVAIFKYEKFGYYFATKDKELLREYLKRRIISL